MSFDALQERLAALQETTAQVKDLIDRLATLNFQPGSVPLEGSNNGDDDDENVATELSAEINQVLREEEEDLELLAEELVDLRGGKEGSEAARGKERLREGVERLEGEVKSCRIAFHKAQLAARRSLETARRLERQILLRSYTTKPPSSTPSRSGATSPAPSLRRRHTTARSAKAPKDDDPVVAASTDLTASLHRAHTLVQSELARSMALHESLAHSTAQLGQLGTAYGRVGDMLTSSRDLLGALLTSTKTDTWYLETTFYLLAATLGWLVFRRWLYGPLWWLVWLPLRLVFRTGSTAVGMVGGGGGGGSPRGATMEVVDGASGRTVGVDMGASHDSVPTAQVGGTKDKVQQGDPDSMVDMVGRIIDNLPPEDEPPVLEQEQEEQQEPVILQEAQPLRDEL